MWVDRESVEFEEEEGTELLGEEKVSGERGTENAVIIVLRVEGWENGRNAPRLLMLDFHS